MAQTILTVTAEVQPASADLLRARILNLRARHTATAAPGAQPYDQLRSGVPSLHFMSLTVFTDDQYDPLFVLEANFDDPQGPFWAQLEAAMGEDLRAIFRHCKPPRDESAELFLAVTEAGSRVPVAPLLEALTVRPLVQHQGNRGLRRARLLQEGKLFSAVEEILGNGRSFRKVPAREIHSRLRNALRPNFPWLEATAEPRISTGENLLDWGRPLLLVVLLLFALAIPGFLVAFVSRPVWCGFVRSWRTWLMASTSVVLTLLVIVLVLARWVRWLERRDPSQDAPKVDQEAIRAMARREDFITQNHMISLVHVKPGVLRAILVRVALRTLGLILRVFRRDGYLSSMRTIHFAHWALVSNGGRLMFHSNYDGSWESYLDDFIEKAHGGLTLAWTTGVGFPPTRYLFQQGATNGRRFKAWARHSMIESQFWFSAYKQYSVNQIERQARVANGLRRPALNDEEAANWAIDL